MFVEYASNRSLLPHDLKLKVRDRRILSKLGKFVSERDFDENVVSAILMNLLRTEDITETLVDKLTRLIHSGVTASMVDLIFQLLDSDDEILNMIFDENMKYRDESFLFQLLRAKERNVPIEDIRKLSQAEDGYEAEVILNMILHGIDNELIETALSYSRSLTITDNLRYATIALSFGIDRESFMFLLSHLMMNFYEYDQLVKCVIFPLEKEYINTILRASENHTFPSLEMSKMRIQKSLDILISHVGSDEFEKLSKSKKENIEDAIGKGIPMNDVLKLVNHDISDQEQEDLYMNILDEFLNRFN